MTTRDNHSGSKFVQHLANAAYTSTQTPSSGVDTQGFASIDFMIDIGTITNIAASPTPSWTFKLQESDSQSSGFADVTDSNQVIIGSSQSPITTPNASTGVFLTIDDASEDGKIYRIGYLGTKRYVRCVATAAEVPGSTPMSITAILSHPANAPCAD
jgi:hypothetical protein